MQSGTGFAIRRRMFSALALAALTLAAANECEYVRLDQAGPFRRIPVHDQGALHTCYAHVAAQLVDSNRDDLPENATTYALEAALGAKADSSPSALTPDWGTPCEAARYLRKHGLCSQSSIAGAFKTADGLDRKIASLAQYHSFYHETKSSPGALEIMSKSVRSYLTEELGLADRFVPSSNEIAALLRQPSPMGFVKNIVGYQCNKSGRSPATADTCSEAKATANTGLQLIHKALDKRKAIAATFCVESLTEERPATCSNHSAVIIGRRPNGPRCEILIRNSWGKSCGRYAPHLECEDGNVWIDSESLAKYLFSVSYLW